jgi:hypothetical protein
MLYSQPELGLEIDGVLFLFLFLSLYAMQPFSRALDEFLD